MLSLRACLGIATIFWTYVSVFEAVRWELMRRASGGILPPDVIALACVLLFPPLWLLTVISWRTGYDLSRWPALLAVNLPLAFIFGLCARPAVIIAAALLRDISLAQSAIQMNGPDPSRALKLWGSSTVGDAMQYLVLQGILAGAAFYSRLRAEQALRERLAGAYDRARLQALRMQANPHFLFNTLSAIAGLIGSRPQAAETMVTQLGELLRATLIERDAEFVTLQRELDLGTQYLEIQRARFDSRFEYRIHAEDSVTAVLVPPLLLQPLLENAAEHGLTSGEGAIAVEVDCRLEADRVSITVSNRAEIDTRLPTRHSHGFGLENVRERLRAAFGEDARLTTRHVQGRLFEARLEFPARCTTC